MSSELSIVIIAAFGLLFFLSALRDFLSLFHSSKFRHKSEVIGFIILFGCLSCLCWIYVYDSYTKLAKTLAPHTTRNILLTVPEKSSVNAQVTSGNNTVNLQNL